MSITRVFWRERQRVHAADLQAEQDYRLRALGRHHLAPHDWGVVRGLWLVPVEARYSRKWQVTPGMAIDGFGRELLVSEPLAFELPEEAQKSGTYRVLLYYCESPSSRPPCAPCREEPSPRTAHFVQLVVSETRSPVTGPAAELSLARAAGRLSNEPSWPVLLGEITLTDPLPTNATTRYHRVFAGEVRAPSGAVTLRQGSLGPTDRYQLLLSMTDATDSIVRRVAIDRDGTAHVWKQLVITGASASTVVALSATAALKIQGEMPAGVGRRVRLAGVLANPNDPTLTLRWRDNAGMHLETRAELMDKGRAFLDRRFALGGVQPIALRLVEAARPERRLQVSHKKRNQAVRSFDVSSFETELAPSGGRLELSTRALAADSPVIAPCDAAHDEPAAESAANVTGGVAYLRPAVQPLPAAMSRAIQAVPVPGADGVPTTMLRLSGGEADDGDHGARVTVGVRDTGATNQFGWRTALAMDGGGRVRLPQPDTTLIVTHTLQLPPITTNPADPLTQDLLALAQSAGLRRAGRIATTQIVAAFSNVPATVKRGDPLTYKINLTQGTADPVTVKRVLELIVGTPTATDVAADRSVTLRSIPALAGALPQTGDPVTVPAFQHAAQHVTLALEVLLTVAGKDYAFAAVKGPIEVTD